MAPMKTGNQIAVQTNLPPDAMAEIAREIAATGESRYAVLRRVVCAWAERQAKARAEAAVGTDDDTKEL